MKNIQQIKNNYQEKISQQYYNKSFEKLHKDERRYCSYVAEIKSYIYIIIPDDFRKFTIFDFVGRSVNDQKLISDEVALSAKNIICQYCWGQTWEKIKFQYNNDDDIKKFLKNNSIMSNRFNNGNNIAIFGESEGNPIGRTLVASIIMKEVIKTRIKSNQRNHTYDWVDFAILKKSIMDDNIDMAEYRSCDWLVIDNITKSDFISLKQRSFISSLIDPFFLGRFFDKLPTFLVFKFDINSKVINLEELMGVGVSKMVNNKRTFKISLEEYIPPIEFTFSPSNKKIEPPKK